MSIEGSSTTTSPRTVSGDATRMGKGKGAAGGVPDPLAGAGAGFLALLNSFDMESLADQGSVNPNANALQPVKDEPVLGLQPPADLPLNLSLPQNLPTDLQLLLAQASEVSIDQSSPLQAVPPGAQLSNSTSPLIDVTIDSASASASAMAPLPLLSKDSSVAQPILPGLEDVAAATSLNAAPLLDTGRANLAGAPSDAALLPKAVLPAAGGVSLPDAPAGIPALAKAVPDAGVVSLASELTGVAVPADLVLLQPGPGPQLRTPKSKFVEGFSGVGGTLTDSRMLSSAASVDLVSREAGLMGALVPGGFSEGLIRPGDRSSGQPSFSLAGSGSGAEGVWGQTSFQPGQAVETASLTAGSSTSSMETMVADTVSYWVTQGVKHAALKLDGFGTQPLEVSISMQGGEAHIDFRTDQPEIRQVLEGAMTHLKDLLKGEGVVLSGVSVGVPGRNTGGSPDERNRPGARQGTAVTAKPSSVDSPRVVNLPAGRVLDLFV